MSDIEQFSLFDLAPPQQGNKATVAAELFATLDDLKAAACNCQKCPLAPTRTHVVVERGNREALIMIIGEGPGENEDLTGLPFVGRAGQLLDKILDSVQLSEQDVYIGNIVKCRPPGNRVPSDDEMSACKPYLLEQIRLVNPRIILLAGATAVRGLLGDKTGITKIRGEWREWNGRLLMPVFHPSYLLRNASREPGSPKWLMWQDIQKVKAKYLEIQATLSNGDPDGSFVVEEEF